MVYRKHNKPIIRSLDRRIPMGDPIVARGKPKPNPNGRKVLKRVPPQYPYRAALSSVSGYAKASFFIEKDGRVSDVKITQAFPSRTFNRSVKNAVKDWKYEPGDRRESASVGFDFKIAGSNSCEYTAHPPKKAS